MKLDITGNPGTGNSFQEYNIQHVDNFNPNATTVVNNYYDGKKRNVVEAQTSVTKDKDTAPLRAEILDYVSRIKRYLSDDWKNGYEKLWNSILDLPEVSSQIYNPGKQQGTNFNRNLVAHIIYYIGMHEGAIPNYNASTLTIALEGDKDHPVRRALGTAPDKDVAEKLKELLENAKH